MLSMSDLKLSAGLALRVGGLLLFIQLVRLTQRLVATRMLIRRVAREHGIPLLPHSFVFGHLGCMAKAAAMAPRDVDANMGARLLVHAYPELAKQGAFYLDLWPINPPMLVVLHPDMQFQFTQEHSLPKAFRVAEAFHHMSQGRDLVSSNGSTWKTWRAIFNPGFSSANIAKMVPAFVDEASLFLDRLRSAARKGETVVLEDPMTHLFVDIMGRLVLGSSLETQTKPSALLEAVYDSSSMFSFEFNPRKLWNPLRPFITWNASRTMNRELMPYIERSIAELGTGQGPKTVLQLAISSYNKDAAKSAEPLLRPGSFDSEFIRSLVAHMIIFLMAGTDTSSATICWVYYLLDTHPEALAKIREEHDKVLGVDLTRAPTVIAEDPSILNRLPYTQAVIKETLRMYPPVSSVRQGEKGFYLTHPETGARYPTEGFMLWSSSHASHRVEQWWPHAFSFIPERWLIRDETDPLYPRKNAWRAFELGNRACIGQELAQTELRLVLALTVREFDISHQLPADGPRLYGELGYQVLPPKFVASHAKDGMPVKVSIRC